MTDREHIGADLYVGPRHPRANTAFEGAFMVADAATWNCLELSSSFTFADASEISGWCVVGDSKEQIIETTKACCLDF